MRSEELAFCGAVGRRRACALWLAIHGSCRMAGALRKWPCAAQSAVSALVPYGWYPIVGALFSKPCLHLGVLTCAATKQP